MKLHVVEDILKIYQQPNYRSDERTKLLEITFSKTISLLQFTEALAVPKKLLTHSNNFEIFKHYDNNGCRLVKPVLYGDGTFTVTMNFYPAMFKAVEEHIKENYINK